MAYPTIEQYQEALQHPSTVFIDPLLAKGKIRASGLGTPLVASGGFALTYGLEVSSKKFAVRCFHREAKGLENRYSAISKKIQNLKSEYFVEFEYQNKGVRIAKSEWPIVKMAWSSGETLGEFVEKNYRDKLKLTNLISSLTALAKYLENSGIAHGDIQDGNLMVADSGKRLQLIDYDGMFVPELAALGSAELGHRDYQHPKRDNTVYDAHLDRFSFIAIVLALRALIEKQDVWQLSQSGAGVIVFKANDYAAPQNSKIFSEIKKISSLKQSVENFTSICLATYAQIPVLDDFLTNKNIPKIAAQPSSSTLLSNPPNLSLRYISQYPVINALDYAEFKKNVGQMVELVGKIQNVKNGLNKYAKPYVFVNFSDWRKNGVKINIWNNAIENGGVLPDESWVGKWVTIKGLVEPPFTSPKVMAVHIAITANALSQITKLTEDEAKYRLGEVTQNLVSESSNGSNADLLKNLMNVPLKNTSPKNNLVATRVKLTPTSSTTNTQTSVGIAMQSAVQNKTSNQIALESMRSSINKSSSLNNSSTNIRSTQAISTSRYQPSSTKQRSDINWVAIIFWAFVIVIALKFCIR